VDSSGTFAEPDLEQRPEAGLSRFDARQGGGKSAPMGQEQDRHRISVMKDIHSSTRNGSSMPATGTDLSQSSIPRPFHTQIFAWSQLARSWLSKKASDLKTFLQSLVGCSGIAVRCSI
jgi:hypothetical protein